MYKIKIRDADEIIIDRLLLLYLINEVNKYTSLGRTKLQKLIFLSEYNMLRNNIKGLNLKFFRWDLGPMSEEIYQDCDFLCSVGLINSTSWPIILTKLGKGFLNSFLYDIRKKGENEIILSIISGVAKNYGSMHINKLKKYVYNITIKPVGMEGKHKIKEIPLGIDIITKIEDKKAKTFFELNKKDIEDFEISLNPSFIKRVRTTIKYYNDRKLKVNDWEEIFSNV